MTGRKSVLDLTLAIPTYNSAPYLPELLDSIVRQSVLPQCLLFTDNCSTDDTVARLERFRVDHPELYVRIYVNETNLGIAGNYNRLIERAFDTTWLQILDSDDYLLGEFYGALERALPSDCDVIVTSMRSGHPVINAYTSAFEHLMQAAGARSVPPYVQVLGAACTRSSLIYRTARLKNEKFADPTFDGSDIIHTSSFLAHNLYWPAARVYYRIHPSSETSQIARSRARTREDHSRYLGFVRTLPLGRRLTYLADFVLRKKVGRLLRVR